MWKLALERLCYVVRAKLERLKGPAKTEENRQIFKPNTIFFQSFAKSGSKDTRVIDVLETTDLPENGHRGSKDFSPPKKWWDQSAQCRQREQKTGGAGDFLLT